MKKGLLVLVVVFTVSCFQNKMRFIHPESGTVETVQTKGHTHPGDSIFVVYHQGDAGWKQVPTGYSNGLNETTPVKVAVLKSNSFPMWVTITVTVVIAVACTIMLVIATAASSISKFYSNK